VRRTRRIGEVINQRLRILYLEDNSNDRELVVRTLRRDGLTCEFSYAATETEFVKALEHFAFDLILSDFTLPTFGGTAALALRIMELCLPQV